MMVLIEKCKFGYSFYRGKEFNDSSRSEILVIKFLFWSLIFFSKQSDITKIFNRSVSTTDKSWCDEIKSEKKRLDEYYEKYWYDKYNDDFERYSKLIKDRDEQLEQYKETTHDLKNLARAVRKVKLFDMSKLDGL